MKCQSVSECKNMDLEELEKNARRLAASATDTIITGNSVVIFTMLLLQEIIERLALDPITNLGNILMVSDRIAALNASILIDP